MFSLKPISDLKAVNNYFLDMHCPRFKKLSNRPFLGPWPDAIETTADVSFASDFNSSAGQGSKSDSV